MKFTANRILTLAGFGHALVFAKGETLFVPPVLRAVAVDMGLDPVLDEGDVAPGGTPKDDADTRRAAVKDAMRAIAQRNNADDFDAGGVPKLRAIENLTGGVKPTDAKERTVLWAEVMNDTGA